MLCLCIIFHIGILLCGMEDITGTDLLFDALHRIPCILVKCFFHMIPLIAFSHELLIATLIYIVDQIQQHCRADLIADVFVRDLLLRQLLILVIIFMTIDQRCLFSAGFTLQLLKQNVLCRPILFGQCKFRIGDVPIALCAVVKVLQSLIDCPGL